MSGQKSLREQHTWSPWLSKNVYFAFKSRSNKDSRVKVVFLQNSMASFTGSWHQYYKESELHPDSHPFVDKRVLLLSCLCKLSGCGLTAVLTEDLHFPSHAKFSSVPPPLSSSVPFWTSMKQSVSFGSVLHGPVFLTFSLALCLVLLACLPVYKSVSAVTNLVFSHLLVFLFSVSKFWFFFSRSHFTQLIHIFSLPKDVFFKVVFYWYSYSYVLTLLFVKIWCFSFTVLSLKTFDYSC